MMDATAKRRAFGSDRTVLATDVRRKKKGARTTVGMTSGILRVLKSGCRWCDCPPESTVDDGRWTERGVCERLFRELAGRDRSTQTQMIDSARIKARRLHPVKTTAHLALHRKGS